MDALSAFRSIEELIKILDREKVLFRDMFEKRKSLAYRTDFALAVVDYKKERIQYLTRVSHTHRSSCWRD